MYELCTLKPPFDGSSFHFLALKIVRGAYPPLPPQYSRDLKTLISQMLSVDPNKRPSIAQILKLAFIKKRIQKLLSESIRQQEFSHTVLHHQNLSLNDEELPRQDKKIEENKARVKPKPTEKNKKPAKDLQKQKSLSKEEKDKVREEKSKKREEDRLKMIEEIRSNKGKHPKEVLIQIVGSNHEADRFIEELQDACTENQNIIPEILQSDNEEMIVKEDCIREDFVKPKLMLQK